MIGDKEAATPNNVVSIAGSDFLINGRPTYEGRTYDGMRIEGLLLNSRMVNGVFDEVYEAVAGLVDKSVLTAEEQDDRRRYRLLETLRVYGLDRLRDEAASHGLAAVDEAQLRSRHRDFYLELAERFHTDWFGPRQLEWSQRMRAERENLRAALGYCLDTPGQQRAGLRLAGALY